MRGTIFLTVSLFLCCGRGEIDNLEPIGYNQKIKDFDMLETKEGVKNWRLNANIAYVYDEKINAKEVNITFFDEEGNISAQISAPRGILNNKTHDMVVLDSVEVITSDSSRFYSDSLFFLNESTLIKTDCNVTIIRPDGTEISGKGLVTTPDLKKIVIGGEIKGVSPLDPEQ